LANSPIKNYGFFSVNLQSVKLPLSSNDMALYNRMAVFLALRIRYASSSIWLHRPSWSQWRSVSASCRTAWTDQQQRHATGQEPSTVQ